MAADDLATQGARASAAMVLEYCSFLVSAPVGLIINTLRPEKNMTTRGRQHFQIQYYDYICLERYRYSSFDSNFPPILSRRSCCWEVSFGSGNGLMLSGIKPLPVPVLTSVGNSTGPPVRDRQLWRRTGNFLLFFLQFYVYDLRFMAWGPTTFLTWVSNTGEPQWVNNDGIMTISVNVTSIHS